MSDSIVIEESNGEIIVIEPTVVINQNAGVDQIPADWEQTDNTKPDFIKNKPTIPGAPVWGEIGGDIGNQSDLVTEFAKKMDVEPMELPSETDIPYINGVYISDGVHYVRYINGNVMTQLSLDAGNLYHSISLDGGTSWYYEKRIASEDDFTTLSLSFDTKVDKVDGKGLSTNDYTTIEKNKLAGIEAGAQVNVIPTWNSVTDKPEIFPPAAHTHSGMVTSSTINTIVTLTQTAYDALNPKVATTLYIITGA